MAEILTEPRREDTKSPCMTNHPCSAPRSFYGQGTPVPQSSALALTAPLFLPGKSSVSESRLSDGPSLLFRSSAGGAISRKAETKRKARTRCLYRNTVTNGIEGKPAFPELRKPDSLFLATPMPEKRVTENRGGGDLVGLALLARAQKYFPTEIARIQGNRCPVKA